MTCGNEVCSRRCSPKYDAKHLPALEADDTAAAQAPAEDETSLMETSIVERHASTTCATGRLSTPRLRLLAAVRRSIREHGIEPSNQVDELLDDRLAHSDRPARTWQSTLSAGPQCTFHPKNARFQHTWVNSPKGGDRMVTPPLGAGNLAGIARTAMVAPI